MNAEAATSSPTDKEIFHAELQAYTASLYDDYKDRHFHNWVVANRDAVVLARSPFDDRVVGSRYAYREWFTGREEVKPDEVPPDVEHRERQSGVDQRGEPDLVSGKRRSTGCSLGNASSKDLQRMARNVRRAPDG